jgi:hypothetical protein
LLTDDWAGCSPHRQDSLSLDLPHTAAATARDPGNDGAEARRSPREPSLSRVLDRMPDRMQWAAPAARLRQWQRTRLQNSVALPIAPRSACRYRPIRERGSRVPGASGGGAGFTNDSRSRSSVEMCASWYAASATSCAKSVTARARDSSRSSNRHVRGFVKTRCFAAVPYLSEEPPLPDPSWLCR